ncbi:MAG: amidase [Vulcanimicrobiaceae bacterium]
MAIIAEYGDLDALGLAGLIRSRELSAQEVLENSIARAEAVNPQINALAYRLYDKARAAAPTIYDGMFAGVPFLVKDLGPELAGAPMTWGSCYFKDYVPQSDDELIVRMRRSGLNIFGKTIPPEFGLVPYTEPRLFGPCRNPWDLERTPGGSSGGSAALVAAGVVPMAHANDMGGSIRIPASCTGLFGLKPSRARVPNNCWRAGDMNADLCVSRSVRDSAAMLDVLRWPSAPGYQAPVPERPYREEVDRAPNRLRIAVATSAMLGSDVDTECRTALEEAARFCERLGHDVVYDEPRAIDYHAMSVAILTIFASACGTLMGACNPTPERRLRPGDLEPQTWAMVIVDRVLSSHDLGSALAVQAQTTRTFAAFMERYDALLTPTLAGPPIRIGELAPSKLETLQIETLARLGSKTLMKKAVDEIASRVYLWTPFTPVFNLTGQPAMSVPLYWTAGGLPVGVQFAAKYGDEATLFRLAGQLEREQPWAARRPPVRARP